MCGRFRYFSFIEATKRPKEVARDPSLLLRMFYFYAETLNWIKNKEKRGYAGDISMGCLIRIYP